MQAVLKGKSETRQQEGGYFWSYLNHTITLVSGGASGGLLYAYRQASIPPAIQNITLPFSIQQNITHSAYYWIYQQFSTLISGNATVIDFLSTNITSLIQNGLEQTANSIATAYSDELAKQQNTLQQDQINYINQLSKWLVAATIVFIASAFISVIIYTRRTDHEKKQSQLFKDYIKNILERLPSIEDEIISKERVISQLSNFLAINSISNKKVLSLGNVDEVKTGEIRIEMEEKHNSPDFRDLLFQSTDAYRDISIYQNIEDTLIKIKDGWQKIYLRKLKKLY